MDKPLTSWKCDVCGNEIENSQDGYVIWETKKNAKSSNFKIIHKSKCDLKSYSGSAELGDFLNQKGLALLLSMFSLGPIKKNIDQTHCQILQTDEFIDFFRRVQTPFYEEARQYFGTPEFIDDYYDSNEVSPYFPENLENIIQTYKKS